MLMNRITITVIVFFVLSYCTAIGAEQPVDDTLPDLIISSEDNYWQPAAFTKVTSGTVDITVDANLKHQIWDGFGGTFNEAGWNVLSEVSAEIPKAMKLLFDAKDGAHFVFGRIPIGSSDYAMDSYSLAETANDYTMKDFSITRDRNLLIPYIKAALEVQPDLHLWASPWTPPKWMMDKSGNMKSDAQTQEAYALYFARFVEEYGKENLTIEAVHPQNEPGYASVKWTQELFIGFIKNYLGPKFTERNLTTEIWCGTMSHPDDAQIAIACMNDDKAMKYVEGFGLQWNLESTVATLAKKGRVWQTEHRCGNYNFEAKYWDQSRYDPNKAQNDHRYGEESWQLIRDWIAAGVHAYSAWNMVLDTYGKNSSTWHQNALLVVDRSAKKLIITPAYWVFRHFSQYIAPGATRIGISGSDDALAFINPDGSIITQVLNKNDASKKITIKVNETTYGFDIPAHGWATHCVRPVTAVNKPSNSQICYKGSAVKIYRLGNGYSVMLPPRKETGHIELLTVSGRLIMSRNIPYGCSTIVLPERIAYTGLLMIRLVYGGTVQTFQIVHLP